MSIGNNLDVQLVNWQTKCGLAIQRNTMDNEKKQSRVYMVYNTDEPKRNSHYTQWKKPETTHHIVYDFIYMKRPKKAIEAKSRLVVAEGAGSGENTNYKRPYLIG